MDSVDLQAELEAAMGRILSRNPPVSQEEVEKWEWQNCVVRDMKALGWDARHCRRIHPDWNCPAQERAFNALSSKLVGHGAIVALVGERGIGKTTLASEHSRLRIEARRRHFAVPVEERSTVADPINPGRYYKLGRLSGMFKPLYADFGSINADDLESRLEMLCREDLVVIDEVHENEDLKTSMRFLVDFVDRRYANHKDTILISNHSPEQFRTEVNPSIISRLGHHGGVMHCSWENHRK